MSHSRRKSPPAIAPPSVSRAVAQIAGVFTLALAIRVIHIAQIRNAPFFTVLMGDARAYDEWAKQLAAGDWVGHDVFYQAPLYPYFLGVIYVIAGRSLLIVRLAQAVIGSAACVLLMLAVRRLFSKRTALIAGLGLALYAPAIFFDGLIQKSVLDVFFVCLALWLMSELVVAPDGRSTRLRWLSLGLALGGLSLTRENALAIIGIVVLWGLVDPKVRQNRGPSHSPGKASSSLGVRSGFGRAISDLACFALGLTIVLVPVAVRNYAVGGGFYLTTSQFGPNFYIGNNANADGTYMSLRYGRGAPEYERQDATDLAEHALGRKLTPGEVSAFWSDRALAFIIGHPAQWLRLIAGKFRLLWNATEMLDTESQESYAEWSMPLRVLGLVGHFGVLVPLALLGVLVTAGEWRRLLLFHLLILTYAATVLMFYVFARYRYPLAPMLIVFAAPGADFAVSRWSLVVGRRRSLVGGRQSLVGGRTRIAAAAAVIATAVFANWPVASAASNRTVSETNLGVALQSDGRLDDAIEHYRRAIRLGPDYAPAYNDLAVALRANGNVDEAIRTYQQALALRSDFPDAHYNLANALLDAHRTDEAVSHFRVALEKGPGDVEVHTNLGVALAAEGRMDDAVAELRTAVRIDPEAANARRNLGDALASMGKVDEGIAELRHAVAAAPNDGTIRYDLASTLFEATRYAEAVDEFRAALQLTPNSADAHNNLGIALASQDRIDEAIGEFREALRIDPRLADAQQNLAIAEARRELSKRERRSRPDSTKP